MAVLWHSLRSTLQLIGNAEVLLFISDLLPRFALINLALFFFNLIPIPPLDGFPILRGLLPVELTYQLDRVQPYSFMIFMGLFFLAPLLGLPILDILIFAPALAVTRLLFGA